MAKKIDIGDKAFSNAIGHLKHKPHRNIIKALDSKEFSLDENNVLNYKPGYLGAKEFEASCGLVERRFGNQMTETDIKLKVYGLFSFIAKQEKPFIEDLKRIAIETIKDLYNVPDHVRLQAFIETNIDLSTDQDHNPNAFLNLSLKKQEEMKDEIQKRIILNGLVHGSSMYIWKSVYYIVRDRLNDLNPMLVQLYDEYTAGVNFLFWTMDPAKIQAAIQSGQQITQGFNEIKFDEPGKPAASVLCKGINFPVLLHELNKGVMDYLICRGIPQEYSEEELQYYYSKADAYEDEIWHYLLSPTLWNDLLDTANVSPEDLPRVIMNLTKLSYQTLTEIFRAMMDDKEKAKIKLEVWKVI
jgi:hypothetical protein